MNFDRAIELRRQRRTYQEIADELGVSRNTIYKRFRKEYELGNLTDLSGYRAARPLDPRNNGGYELRCGAVLPVGKSIAMQLTVKEKHAVLGLMQKGRHRTMNDLLLELLRREMG
jgi:AcrR family transcriptional regulator